MPRFAVTMILPDFGLLLSTKPTPIEIRREFLRTLQQDLESIEPYFNDETIKITFVELKEVPEK